MVTTTVKVCLMLSFVLTNWLPLLVLYTSSDKVNNKQILTGGGMKWHMLNTVSSSGSEVYALMFNQ